MGTGTPKPRPPTLEEQLLNMRMTAKRFEREANRAEKDKKKEMEKARNAIRKNNDDGAKLFLANAAMKAREQMSMQRMANKMDALTTTIKGNVSNVDMVNALNKITPLLNAQTHELPVETLANNVQMFDKAMDDIMVSGKIMDATVMQNTVATNNETSVDNMFMQLKKEMYSELSNDLNPTGLLFQDLKNPMGVNPNQQTQVDVKKI